MPRYKYPSAHEWLYEFIDEAPELTLRTIAHQLAEMFDGDQIQDLFQSDMDRDGFFIDLDAEEADTEA